MSPELHALVRQLRAELDWARRTGVAAPDPSTRASAVRSDGETAAALESRAAAEASSGGRASAVRSDDETAAALESRAAAEASSGGRASAVRSDGEAAAALESRAAAEASSGARAPAFPDRPAQNAPSDPRVAQAPAPARQPVARDGAPADPAPATPRQPATRAASPAPPEAPVSAAGRPPAPQLAPSTESALPPDPGRGPSGDRPGLPVHDPRQALASATDLDEVRRILGDCTRCKLHGGRTQIVFGVGRPDAEVMFIGEGPGADEDRRGEPFVGKAGQLLTRIIEGGMGMSRSDVYIANVVKCRPPRNRNPQADEVEACEPFLEAQVRAVRPRVLILLGRVAAQTLLRTDVPMGQIRGRWTEVMGVPAMPTFHPAYLLRNPAEKRPVWEDIQEVLRFLGRPVPGSARAGRGGAPE